MLGSKGRFSVVAMAAALLTAGYSNAADADTVRLGGTGRADDAPAQNLIQRVGDDDAETIQTRARGGFVAGGYRGGGGGRGGFVAAGYRSGGYRGGYYGGYRGGVRVGVGVGGYRGGYWGGYGYRGGYWGGYGYRGGVRVGVGIGYGGYRPYWGYRPYYGGYGYGYSYGVSVGVPYYSYSYTDPCCYYGISDTSGAYPSNDLTMQVPLSSRQAMPRIEDNGAPVPQPNANPLPNGGPYRYDGGPTDPVPMPMTKPAPAVKATAPDRFVSLPAPTTAKKYTYAAYGEKREQTGEKQFVIPGDDTKNLLVRADVK